MKEIIKYKQVKIPVIPFNVIWTGIKNLSQFTTQVGGLIAVVCLAMILWQTNQKTLSPFEVATKDSIYVIQSVFYMPDGNVAVHTSASDEKPEFNPATKPTKSAKPKGNNDPVKYSGKLDPEVLAYIERFAPIAKQEMEKFGIPASIALAQGICESEWGKSTLAKTANNHFGIKCFSKGCKKGHCVNYEDDHPKDRFRKYDRVWASWRAHSILLSGDHYKSLKNHGKDYKKWAWGLQNKGYATSKTYAKTLIEWIEKYNLTQYDK